MTRCNMLQNFKYMQDKKLGDKKNTPGAGNRNLLSKLKERVFKTRSMFSVSIITFKSIFYY